MARRFALRALMTSLLLLVLWCAVSAAEGGYFGFNDSFYWTLDDAGCLTVRGDGRMPNFSNASFQPWYGCRARITSVDFDADSVGNYAFAGLTNLTEVCLSPYVQSIGNSAFRFCSGLKSFTVPEGVTGIGSQAFADCAGLTEITLPDGVASIGVSAFSNAGLIDIILPESLTAVSDGLFSGCGDLERCLVPYGVTEIGQSAFAGCSSLPELVLPGKVTKIGSYAFRACTALEGVGSLSDVEKLGTGAFDSHTVLYADRDTLGALTLSMMGFDFRPSGAEYSLKYLFEGSDTTAVVGMILTRANKSLRSLTVPNHVTAIADYAFYNCAELTDLYLPDTLTSVGNYAFYGCVSLRTATFGGTESQWQAVSVGENNNPLLAALVIGGGTGPERILVLPAGLREIGSEAFRGLSSADAVRIPADVTDIAPDAFDPGTLLLVPSGSPWAQWAADNGYEFLEE